MPIRERAKRKKIFAPRFRYNEIYNYIIAVVPCGRNDGANAVVAVVVIADAGRVQLICAPVLRSFALRARCASSIECAKCAYPSLFLLSEAEKLGAHIHVAHAHFEAQPATNEAPAAP